MNTHAQDVPLEYVQPAPRRRRVKGLTTFNIVMMLMFFAVLITFYISNVVKVDTLMMEAVLLDRQEQTLVQERENLRAEINTLTSYNRIQRIAVEDLGLVHADQQPFSLTVFDLAEEQTGQ